MPRSRFVVVVSQRALPVIHEAGTGRVGDLVASLRGPDESATLWGGMSAIVNPAQLLREIVEPLGRALTPSSAREILSVRASEAARERIADLAERCNHGTLTPEEKAEYQLFVEVGDAIALLQTRARLYLSEHRA